MITIKEKSTSRLSLTFRDEDNVLSTPASGAMKIIDVKTGTIIRDWVGFNPASSTHIVYITSEENRILNTKNVTELRRVYVRFAYGAGYVGHSEYEYAIKNLGGVV